MKNTAQILTVSMNKEYWSKGDLLKIKNRNKTIFSIASADYGTFMSDEMFKDKFIPQQFLVTCDEPIEITDKFVWIDGLHLGVCTAIPMDVYIGNDEIPVGLIGETGRKVIASYPHIEGTLQIPKQVIQQWIDSNKRGNTIVDFIVDNTNN